MFSEHRVSQPHRRGESQHAGHSLGGVCQQLCSTVQEVLVLRRAGDARGVSWDVLGVQLQRDLIQHKLWLTSNQSLPICEPYVNLLALPAIVLLCNTALMPRLEVHLSRAVVATWHKPAWCRPSPAVRATQSLSLLLQQRRPPPMCASPLPYNPASPHLRRDAGPKASKVSLQPPPLVGGVHLPGLTRTQLHHSSIEDALGDRVRPRGSQVNGANAIGGGC